LPEDEAIIQKNKILKQRQPEEMDLRIFAKPPVIPEEHKRVLDNATKMEIKIFYEAYDKYMRLKGFEDKYKFMLHVAKFSELGFDRHSGEFFLKFHKKHIVELIGENILQQYIDDIQGKTIKILFGKRMARRMAVIGAIVEGLKFFDSMSNEKLYKAYGAKAEKENVEIKLRLVALKLAESKRFTDPTYVGKLLDRYNKFETAKNTYERLLRKYQDPSSKKAQERYPVIRQGRW